MFKNCRVVIAFTVAALYFCIPVADYFYARKHNLSIYSGLIGWLAISPVFIGIIVMVIFFRRKNSRIK